MSEFRFLLYSLRYPPLWGVLALAALLYVLAIQLPFRTELNAASFRADPYLINFQDRGEANGREGRWTHNYSYIRFPGTGGNRPLHVTLELNPYRGDIEQGDPVEVVGFAGGQELYRGTLTPGSGWVTVEMEITPSTPQPFAARDLVIELRADTYRSPNYPGKDLGVLLGRVGVEPLPESPSQLVVPNARTLILSVAMVLLLYILLTRAGGLFTPLRLRRTALTLTLLTSLLLGWATATGVSDVGLATPHLTITLAVAYLLLVLADYALPSLFRRESRELLRWVGVAFAAAFLIRFGISGLPQTNVVDLPYHTKWLNVLLNGGFMELYLPGELSTVPPEWGLDVLIPKSPLFYVVLWPLGILRAFDLPYMMMLAVSLMDAFVVLGIFALVRQASRSGAIWSALIYAVVPLSLRAFIYGILPTIFAQALTLAVLLAMVLWLEKLYRPLIFTGLVLLLTASLLSFPTALAFNSFLVVALGLGWAWQGAAPRRAPLLLLGALALAIGISFAVYYGLYVDPFLSRTLPALQGGVSLGGRELWPGGLPDILDWTARYAIAWVLWLLIPSALLLLWRSSNLYARRLWILLAAWLLLFLAGLLANLRIDMIGKHIYYTLPAACIAGGLVLAALWSRRGNRAARALCLLTFISLLWAGLQFFSDRL
jgi:hypothetical protein